MPGLPTGKIRIAAKTTSLLFNAPVGRSQGEGQKKPKLFVCVPEWMIWHCRTIDDANSSHVRQLLAHYQFPSLTLGSEACFSF